MERIPILRMGRFLLVTVQVDMHDELVQNLQDDLTQKITKFSARGVLLDISALEMVDSFIGRMIGNTAGMARVGKRSTGSSTFFPSGRFSVAVRPPAEPSTVASSTCPGRRFRSGTAPAAR